MPGRLRRRALSFDRAMALRPRCPTAQGVRIEIGRDGRAISRCKGGRLALRSGHGGKSARKGKAVPFRSLPAGPRGRTNWAAYWTWAISVQVIVPVEQVFGKGAVVEDLVTGGGVVTLDPGGNQVLHRAGQAGFAGAVEGVDQLRLFIRVAQLRGDFLKGFGHA